MWAAFRGCGRASVHSCFVSWPPFVPEFITFITIKAFDVRAVRVRSEIQRFGGGRQRLTYVEHKQLRPKHSSALHSFCVMPKVKGDRSEISDGSEGMRSWRGGTPCCNGTPPAFSRCDLTFRMENFGVFPKRAAFRSGESGILPDKCASRRAARGNTPSGLDREGSGIKLTGFFSSRSNKRRRPWMHQ